MSARPSVTIFLLLLLVILPLLVLLSPRCFDVVVFFCCYCCWTGLLQMIIWINQPLANDHPYRQASCNWSSGSTGLLQIIIWIDRPFANDHLDQLASCKWSSLWTGLLQIVIRIDRTLANDHPKGPASCKCNLYHSASIQMCRGREVIPYFPIHPIFLFDFISALEILDSCEPAILYTFQTGNPSAQQISN